METQNSIKSNSFEIPKSVVFGFMGTVLITLASSWITFQVKFAHIEKEIEILNIKLAKEHSLIEKNLDRFDSVTEQLHRIEKILNLKQDRRFAE